MDVLIVLGLSVILLPLTLLASGPVRIVLGLAFHLAGRMFASLGALNDWPPFVSATAMTGLFLSLGMLMLWWTERR